MPVSSQLLKPVTLRYILLTMLLALLFASVPWNGLVRNLLPDMVLLVLLYWCMNQSRRVGVGSAFWLGLMVDIADGTVFGQHSLAYCLVAYLASSRSRQLNMFPLWQQSLYVLPLLLLSQGGMLLIRQLTGGSFPGWTYFLGAVSGALLWGPFNLLLLWPQRKERKSELD